MIQAKSTRELFVEAFGEGQARAVEEAAKCHLSPANSENKGSDEFRWAICICIGHDCLKDPEYREGHGITVPFEELKEWIREKGDLAHHNGDVDYLSLFIGKYNQFVPEFDEGEGIAATFVEPETQGKAN